MGCWGKEFGPYPSPYSWQTGIAGYGGAKTKEPSFPEQEIQVELWGNDRERFGSADSMRARDLNVHFVCVCVSHTVVSDSSKPHAL